MQFIIFHPSWGVPPGMKANELWPQLRQTGGWLFGTSASSVLRSHGLQVSHAGRPVDPDSVNWGSVDSSLISPSLRADQCSRHVKFRFTTKRRLHAYPGAAPVRRHDPRLAGCMPYRSPCGEVLAADKGWSPERVQNTRRGGESSSTAIPVRHLLHVVVDGTGK
jgi:hypothetical protein